MIKIGSTQIAEHPALDQALEGFKEAINESDLNVTFIEKNAQGDMSSNTTIAQSLVSRDVDLIFANSTQSAQAVLTETSEIPIVFTDVTDPVGANLVPSMDEAGKTIIGSTDTFPEVVYKTVDFIAEYLEAESIGLIYNPGEQKTVVQIERARKAIDENGLSYEEAVVSTTAEVKQAAESLVGNTDVIYLVKDNTTASALESIVKVAEDNDMPLLVGDSHSVKRGGFAAYGVNYIDLGYQTGQMALKILEEGVPASDIAPQFPNQDLQLTINREAAEKMGIEILDEWEDIANFIN